MIPHDNISSARLTGVDPAPGPDITLQTMFIPHPGRPGCGYTAIFDTDIRLFRLGVLPVCCKSCGELLTDREGA